MTDTRSDVFRLVEEVLGEGYACELVSTPGQAARMLAIRFFDLVLFCLDAPDESQLSLIEGVMRGQPGTAVVVIAEEESAGLADYSRPLAAHGYLVKPLAPGQLKMTLSNVLARQRLEKVERERNAVLLASVEKRSERISDELVSIKKKAIGTPGRHLVSVDMPSATVRDPHLANPRRDRHTAAISGLLGRKRRLGHESVLLLRRAAQMCDLGNRGISEQILSKPGTLTRFERHEVERHTTIGHRILANARGELPRMAATIALTHHERWDGTGYPRKLHGTDIPLEGRIVAIADTFDALLSDRPYRSALCPDDAIAVMGGERGSHFDPRIFDIFLEHIDEVLCIRC